jgi:hypothetical protein
VTRSTATRSVVRTAREGEQFVVTIGFAYRGDVWREVWPKAIGNFVAASETTGARMVFIDNLYMYGPQTVPLVETMQLSDFGRKPAARAVATRIWMEACTKGRARVGALRAPDFYGPGVGLSYLGDVSIGAMAKGKAATFLGLPDLPHDYAYLPDISRAVASLFAAPDTAFGQAWHVPLRPDPDDASNPRGRGGCAWGQAPPPRHARGPHRPARPLHYVPQRAERDALHLRPRLSRRCEQVRQNLLVRPDVVRGRRAQDGARLPRGIRQGMSACRDRDLRAPAGPGSLSLLDLLRPALSHAIANGPPVNRLPY